VEQPWALHPHRQASEVGSQGALIQGHLWCSTNTQTPPHNRESGTLPGGRAAREGSPSARCFPRDWLHGTLH
jgi:hypothetical protein